MLSFAKVVKRKRELRGIVTSWRPHCRWRKAESGVSGGSTEHVTITGQPG